MNRAYGWKPDLPDKRDRYHVPKPRTEPLPARVDHSGMLPQCWDQGSLGACTAFAIGGAFTFERGVPDGFARMDGNYFCPSFLQPYYAAREMEGTTGIDAGAYIRDICKVAAQQGIAPASAWPYEPAFFAHKPNRAARKLALDNRVSSYARVRQTLPELKAALAGGDTIVFGATLYESFEQSSFGFIPMPQAGEDMLGGHAMLLVGYDDGGTAFRVRNSWGTQWGLKGHCYFPYDYITDPDLCADFWVVKEVTP